MVNRTTAVLVMVATVAIASATLFFWQGGFGAGHGNFDRAIFIMGLPWAAVPWPGFLVRHDFVWLIGLPLVLNVTSVLLAAAVIRVVRHAIGNRR